MIDHVPTISDDDAEVDNEDAVAHKEEAGDGHSTAGTSRVCSPFLSILLAVPSLQGQSLWQEPSESSRRNPLMFKIS